MSRMRSNAEGGGLSSLGWRGESPPNQEPEPPDDSSHWWSSYHIAGSRGAAKKPGECILQTTQLANASQSGTALMNPQRVPPGLTSNPIPAPGGSPASAPYFARPISDVPQARLLLYGEPPCPPHPTARVCKMQHIWQEICSSAPRTAVSRSRFSCGNHSHDCNPFNWWSQAGAPPRPTRRQVSSQSHWRGWQHRIELAWPTRRRSRTRMHVNPVPKRSVGCALDPKRDQLLSSNCLPRFHCPLWTRHAAAPTILQHNLACHPPRSQACERDARPQTHRLPHWWRSRACSIQRQEQQARACFERAPVADVAEWKETWASTQSRTLKCPVGRVRWYCSTGRGCRFGHMRIGEQLLRETWNLCWRCEHASVQGHKMAKNN